VLAITAVIEVCAATSVDNVGYARSLCVVGVASLDGEEYVRARSDETRTKNNVPSDCALGTL
jgi:hypothetical protein